jgi:CDP-4-dehydro-6-deoxyglucose reductase, E1
MQQIDVGHFTPTPLSSQRTRYPLAASTFGVEEIEAAKAVLDSGRLTMGPLVQAFESEFAAWTGAEHALMVNSGSSANLLMVDAMLRRSRRPAAWQAGDEVLVPGLAWSTTVWPLAQLGLVPVFVDIDPNTLAIDLESAKAALTSRTRGMFLIHVLGQVPAMDAYVAFCRQNDLVLLEDACESLGGHFAGRHVGTFAPMGAFSCYFSHHISTIEGGVIITSDSELLDDLKSLRAHGWVRDRSDASYWKEQHPELDPRFLFISGGYNVRPTEIQAAVGRVQLHKLDEMLAARERLARRVHDWTARSAPWLRLVGADRLGAPGSAFDRRQRTHSWMTLPFVLDEAAPVDIQTVKETLEESGVETRPMIAGNLSRHPAIRQFTTRSADTLSRCDALLTQGFMIGCHPAPAPGSMETLERALASLARF